MKEYKFVDQELQFPLMNNHDHRGMTAMQQLKAATTPYHIALEQQVNLQVLSTSLAHYQCLLQRFYGFYRPGEAQLATLPWADVGFDWPARQHIPPLAADLQWLGESPTTLAALPQCHTLPPLGDIPRALGYLYVVEGSTLGGQLISRHLQQHLPISSEAGSQFFNRYGAQVGPMWRAFSHFVNSYVATQPLATTPMIETACATFHQLQQWLQR